MADDFGQMINTLYKDGDTIVSTDGGFPALGKKGSAYAFLELDATSGGLKVDIVDATGITVDVDVYQYQDGVSNAAAYGTVAMGDDGTNLQFLSVDTSGQLQTAHDANSNPIFAKITDGTEEWSIDSNNYGEVSIREINLVSQTTDVKVSLDGETVELGAGTAIAGKMYVTDGTDDLAVNTDGSINVVSIQGDATWDYGSANLVKDTPTLVNSYSPGAGSDKAIGVLVSGFGLCEWTIKFGVTASEATIAVVQTTPSSPSKYLPFPESIEVQSTETILVNGENKENAASAASDFTGHATIIYED